MADRTPSAAPRNARRRGWSDSAGGLPAPRPTSPERPRCARPNPPRRRRAGPRAAAGALLRAAARARTGGRPGRAPVSRAAGRFPYSRRRGGRSSPRSPASPPDLSRPCPLRLIPASTPTRSSTTRRSPREPVASAGSPARPVSPSQPRAGRSSGAAPPPGKRHSWLGRIASLIALVLAGGLVWFLVELFQPLGHLAARPRHRDDRSAFQRQPDRATSWPPTR